MSRFSNSPGSIYPALERLFSQDWLTRNAEPGLRGRARHLYELTPDGSDALQQWLQQTLTLDDVRSDLDSAILRFTFMQGRLTDSEVIHYLDCLHDLLVTYRDEMDAYVMRLQEMGATYAGFGARNGTLSIDAHLQWISEIRTTFLVDI